MALTITIPGAVEATIGATAPAVLTIGVGTPGATGPAGPAGQGVPVGGTAGQFLTKIDSTNYNTDWTTVNLSVYAVKANNLSDLASASTARTNLGLGSLAVVNDAPSDGSQYARKNAAWEVVTTTPDFISSVSSPLAVTTGNLTVDLSAYLTSATAASTYQTLAGMSSYLTTATAASTYAVIAAGQPTSGTVGQVLTKNSGTNYDSSWATLIPGDRYLTSSTTSNTVSNGNKTFTIGTGLSYTPTQSITIAYDAANHMHGEVLTYNSGTGVLTVDINHHTGAGTYAAWVVNIAGVVPATSVAWGAITGTLGDQSDLATALNSKLELSGGVLDANATIEASTATQAAVFSGTGLNAQLTANPSENVTVNYSGLQVQNFTGTMSVGPAGLTFPNSSVQTVAFPGFAGYATESWVTAGFYPLVGNPSAFLVAADITGKAPLASPALTGNVTITSNSTSPALVITQDGTGDVVQFKDVASDTTYTFIDAAGKVNTIPSTTANAGFNVPHATAAPTSPVNGDIWTTTGGLFARINAGTQQYAALSANNTFSNASSTYGNSTAAGTINIGTGATLTATTKAINIGTNGVSGSTTNITLGSAVSGATNLITVNGPMTVGNNFTATGLNINIGTLTATAFYNFGTGALSSGQTRTIGIGTSALAGSTNAITIGSTAGTSTTTLQGTTTFAGPITAAINNISLGSGTAAQVMDFATGVTATGLTKAVSIGTNGAAGSTTNIAIGSTTGTSTTTLQGITNGVTEAVDTNNTELATTAFVVGQAGSATPLVNGTAAVGTSLRYARQDHVHGTDTTRAPLASPTFTGTPLSTTAAVDTNTTQIATTAYVVGQGYLKSATASSTYAPLASPALTGTPTAPTATLGTNTTQIATTAFVTAAVGTAATIDQVRTGSSTTTSINPSNLQAALMSPDMMPVPRSGFTATTSGTGAACTLGFTNTFYQLPTSGASGHSYARTYGLSQVDQITNLWGDDNAILVNFAKRVWISGRSIITFSTTAYGVHRVSFGKQESSGVGDLALRGIGWKYTTGASQFVQLMVHNGTTLTTVNSSFTPTDVAFDWDVVSDGAGNVTLYINGASVATTAAGPSTRATTTLCLYQEESVVSTTIPNAYCRLYCARGSIFVQR